MKPQCSHTIMIDGIVVVSFASRFIVACTSIIEYSLTVHWLSLQRGQVPAPRALSALTILCLSSAEIPLYLCMIGLERRKKGVASSAGLPPRMADRKCGLVAGSRTKVPVVLFKSTALSGPAL
jgi:hypothetical protein